MTVLSIGSSPLDLEWTVHHGLQSFALKFTGADLTGTVFTLKADTITGPQVFTAVTVGDTATWTIDETINFFIAHCELIATTGGHPLVIASGKATLV